VRRRGGRGTGGGTPEDSGDAECAASTRTSAASTWTSAASTRISAAVLHGPGRCPGPLSGFDSDVLVRGSALGPWMRQGRRIGQRRGCCCVRTFYICLYLRRRRLLAALDPWMRREGAGPWEGEPGVLSWASRRAEGIEERSRGQRRMGALKERGRREGEKRGRAQRRMGALQERERRAGEKRGRGQRRMGALK
jgi:hypothetical protein